LCGLTAFLYQRMGDYCIGIDCADFIAQFGEIGRKNRRRDE
jgi:hypothetical protein